MKLAIYLTPGSDMESKFKKFIYLMDTKDWVRIAVCMVPGLVLHKLANQLEASDGVRLASTSLIVVGAIVWLGWSRLRDLTTKAEVEVADELVPTVIPAEKSERSQVTMADLIAVCGGDASQAIDAMNVEITLAADITATEAIERATRRKVAEAAVRDGRRRDGY